MSNFILTDRKTDYLLPPSVEDWLTQDHLARFVVEVIDGLDLSRLTRRYAVRTPLVTAADVLDAKLREAVGPQHTPLTPIYKVLIGADRLYVKSAYCRVMSYMALTMGDGTLQSHLVRT